MADINLGVGGANSAVAGGYDIDNSVKVEADNDERFTRTPSSAGNRKTWTFSAWVKRTELGANQILISAADTYLYFGSDDKIHCNFRPASENFFLSTNRLFRDTSAWYHIVVQCDTTDSTAADRAKLYINGVRETSYSSSTYQNMSQNLDTSMNNTIEHMIGRYSSSDDYRMSGYISEFHLVDGTALTPTSFGEYDDDSGIWKPKAYTGSYGTNGFYFKFDSASDMGNDSSGNNNDFSVVNINQADQATDTPTNNFCTLNPIFVGNQSTPPSDGATYMSDNGTNQDVSYAGTMGVTKGKWYYETYIDMRSTSYGLAVYAGYHTFKDNYRANAYWSSTNQASVALYGMHTGQYWTWNGGSRSVTSGLGSIGTSGVGKFVGIALNLDDNQISFYYDGSAVTNGTNLALNDLGTDADAGIFAIPAISVYDNNHTVNFGGYTKAPISSAQSDENGYGTFEHAPPSGYLSICSQNLASDGGSA